MRAIVKFAQLLSTIPGAPTLISATPNHGLDTGGTAVTLGGTNLVSVLYVKFGTSLATAKNATSVTWNSANNLSVVAPPNTAGSGYNIYIGTFYGAAQIAYTYDASVSPAATLSAVSSDLVDTAGGDTVTVQGTQMSGGVLQSSPDGTTWTSLTSPANTSTTCSGIMPAIAAGLIFLRVLGTGSVPSTNTITIEAWNPTLDPTVTLLFDAKSNPYIPGTGAGGTWTPRYALTAGTTMTMSPGSGGTFASDGAGGVVMAGIGSSGTQIALSTTSALLNGFLSAAAASQQAGSYAAVFSSQTTFASTLAAAASTPYNLPGVISNPSQGTTGIEAFTASDDGNHRIAAHIYGAGGYTGLQVPVPAGTALHAVVSRWHNNVPGSTLRFGLSVDGSLFLGSGYVEATNDAYGTDVTYTGTPIQSGVTYSGGGQANQLFKGTIKSLCVSNVRASDAFITKFARWKIARFGGGPALGSPWLSSSFNSSGNASNLFDTLGGDVVTVQGITLSGLTSVTLGGTVITITPISSTSFSFVMPAKAIGVYALIATNSVGSSPPMPIEAWDPGAIAGIDGYFDARKGIVYATAPNMASWTEQSRNDMLYTAYTGGTAPTAVANVFGTKPSVRSVAGNSGFYKGAARSLTANGRSCFWVAKTTNVDAVVDAYAGNSPMTIVGDASGGIYCAGGMSSGSVDVTQYSAGSWTHKQFGGGLTDGNAHLAGFTHDTSGNIRGYQDGQLLTAAANVPYGASNNEWSSIGIGYSGADGFIGDMGAVVVVAGVISATDYAKLTKWASQTWGVVLVDILLTSSNMSTVKTAGGQAMTLTAAANQLSLVGATLTVGGATVACTSTSTTVSFTMPAKAAGVYDIQVTVGTKKSNKLSIVVDDAVLVWLDADHATLSSGKVSAIPNTAQGGLALGVSQSTVSMQPAFTAARLGERPAVVFDGVDDTLLSASVAAQVSPLTAYFVAEWDAFGSLFLLDDVTGSVSRICFFDSAVNGPLQVYVGPQLGGGVVASGARNVWCIVFNGSTSSIYQNDPVTPVTPSGNLAGAQLISLRLGTRYSGDYPWNGALGQMSFHSGVHSTALRTAIMNALRARYGT